MSEVFYRMRLTELICKALTGHFDAIREAWEVRQCLVCNRLEEMEKHFE